MVERTHTPPAEPHYAVRHLARWSLGTSYPAIVADVAAMLNRAPKSGRLKIVESLELRPALINELASFKLKINIATGNDGSPSVLVHSARQHEEDAGEADPAWHVHTSVASGFSTCSRTPRLGPGSRAN